MSDSSGTTPKEQGNQGKPTTGGPDLENGLTFKGNFSGNNPGQNKAQQPSPMEPVKY